MRRRLDAEMRRRGLADDLDSAAGLIAAGRVTVDGAPADKAARLVETGAAIAVAPSPPRFVSRGGEKLAAALERFDVPVRGRRALDAGASTGGFTDCLLQFGAAEVIAVDVGRGQIHRRIESDPRVEVRERTNLRLLQAGDLGPPVQLAVADLSFIALRSVLDAMFELTDRSADLVLLIKPQFEANRNEVDAGRGVITDPEIWRRVLRENIAALEHRGAAIMGVMTSPLRGADGNVEFLVHARRGAPASTTDLAAAIDRMVADASGAAR